jgi:ABC-type amino acid transport substrate-binding protein
MWRSGTEVFEGLGMLIRAALILLSMGALAAYAQEHLPKQIHLVSERWPAFTEVDGSGVAWEVLKLVFEPAGVEVHMNTVPYSRSVGLVMRGEADAWVGAYANEVAGARYPRWHFDRDHVSALGLASTPPATIDSLARSRLVWIRGYRYERYLPATSHFLEIPRRENVLPMLDAGRVDYFVDARVDIEMLLSTVKSESQYVVSDLLRLPLYLGFAETAEALALADLYDRRMQHLVSTGELRPIYARWNWEYPFDE